MTEYIASSFSDFPGARLNDDRRNRLPGTGNLSFTGIGGRELLFLLDAKYGVCASGGSACSASSSEPSHVLTAMGLPKEKAEIAVRISLSPENTMDDAAYIVKAIKESVVYLILVFLQQSLLVLEILLVSGNWSAGSPKNTQRSF